MTAAPAGPGKRTRRLSGVRGMIARRLHRSLQETAQLSFSASIDATAILELAARGARSRDGARATSVEDLVAYVLAAELALHPELNGTIEEDVITLSPAVHLGVALAAGEHLVVPVIRNAESLGIDALAEARRQLVEKAIAGTLVPDDMRGGTITLSNLGRGRTETFTPILNPPQIALLGIAGLRQAPWVSTDGDLCVRPVLTMSLTVDHRAIDGAPANAFLTALAERLEAGG